MQKKHLATPATRLQLWGALALAAAATACAPLPPAGGQGMPQAQPEQQVSARAQARWDALLERRFDQDYTFHTPAYRAATTAAQHAQKYGAVATWKGADVVSVTCEEPTRCTVQMRIRAEVVHNPGFVRVPITTSLPELWLLQEGQWYYYQAP